MYGNSFYQQPFYQQSEQQKFYLQEPYQGFQEQFQGGQPQHQTQQPYHGFQQVDPQFQSQFQNFQHHDQNFQPPYQHQQNFQQPYNNFQPQYHLSQHQNNQFQQAQSLPSNQNFSQPYGDFQRPLNQGFQGTNFQQHSWNCQGNFQHQNPSFQAQNQCQSSFSQSGQISNNFQQPTYFQDQQNSYSIQEDYENSIEFVQQQQRLEEMIQQMAIQQQNLERQFGQLVNSMNQIQAQRSSTQESEFHEGISATPSPTQISLEMDFTVSRVEFSLEDALVTEEDDIELISDAIVVEDVQMGVGDCTEPQGPPLVIEVSEDSKEGYLSVGDCMEALPQESLPVRIQSLESEQESSFEEDEVEELHSQQIELICDHSSPFHASGTSYISMDIIHANYSENIIEVPVFDFIGCESFIYACPKYFDIVSSALSYSTCVWKIGSIFGLADLFETSDCALSLLIKPPLMLKKDPTFQATVELPMWVLHLNLLRPPERIIEEIISEEDLFTSPTAVLPPGWKIHLNLLRPPEAPSKEVKNFKEATQHINDHIMKSLTSPRSIPLPAWILLLNRLQPPGLRGVCSNFALSFHCQYHM